MTVTTKFVITAVTTKLVLTAITTKLVVTAVMQKLVVSAYFSDSCRGGGILSPLRKSEYFQIAATQLLIYNTFQLRMKKKIRKQAFFKFMPHIIPSFVKHFIVENLNNRQKKSLLELRKCVTA